MRHPCTHTLVGWFAVRLDWSAPILFTLQFWLWANLRWHVCLVGRPLLAEGARAIAEKSCTANKFINLGAKSQMLG